MIFRLLLLGLCTATVVMLATWQPVRIELRAPGNAPPRPLRVQPASVAPMQVIDVARSVAPVELAALLRLSSCEEIVAINDRAVDRKLGLDASTLVGSVGARPGEFVDLTVASARGERRILMLVH